MNKSTDFIKGNIFKSILFFSLPLLVGNLFMQFYNTVDSYIVGNYVSAQALAAVGQSTPIVNVIVGFFMGLSTGAGVVVSQFYGSEDQRRMSLAIHTAMAFSLVLCVIFTILGLATCTPILHFIKCPHDIMDMASLYLRIYFWGISFNLIYNMASGILRAVGDSKRPLYYLIVSSLVNIVLDFLFVLGFHLGVAGAAYATLIAQGVSCFLALFHLMKTDENYRLELKKLRFDVPTLTRIVKIGIPAALQISIISFSNVYVMSYINAFGTTAVAGYSSYVKIDGFVIIPIQAFSMAVTTFTGQNYGARQFKRIRQGMYATILMSTIVSTICVIIIYFFGRNLVGLFTNRQDVINYGYKMAQVFMLGYLIISIPNVMTGVLRGVGKSFVPMIVLIFCYVILRQIYLAIVTKISSSIAVVYAGWPITWVICAIILIIYYKLVFKLPEELD